MGSKVVPYASFPGCQSADPREEREDNDDWREPVVGAHQASAARTAPLSSPAPTRFLTSEHKWSSTSSRLLRCRAGLAGITRRVDARLVLRAFPNPALYGRRDRGTSSASLVLRWYCMS